MEPAVHTFTDTELVAMTLKERSSFGFLIERYEAKLRRYINRLGVWTKDDQDDVLQDIFIKVYRSLNDFDTSLSFSSWIYRIAHNEAISWYRKQRVRPEGHALADSEEVLTRLVAREATADVEFDQSVNAQELSRALTLIDPKYREVLVLRYFEQMEYAEISDILEMPVGSVGTLILRGKKALYNAINHATVRI